MARISVELTNLTSLVEMYHIVISMTIMAITACNSMAKYRVKDLLLEMVTLGLYMVIV